MGKIVVTNSLAKDLYAKEFGSCALQIANDSKALEQTLKMILSLSEKEIQDKKHESREWVEQKHSIPATAKRLWDKVYSKLL
jgi:ribonuclease HI